MSSSRRQTLAKLGVRAGTFLFVWFVSAFLSKLETKVDSDLGTAPSVMTFRDNLIWTLPLSSVVWLSGLLLWFLVRSVFKSKSMPVDHASR